MRILILFVLLTLYVSPDFAQAPIGKSYGFGFIVGEPLGLTAKIWTTGTNAVALSVGTSFFGLPRVGADCIWHFDVFDSRDANLYFGPGLAFGIGELRDGIFFKYDTLKRNARASGFGMRAVIGINYLPEKLPLELFIEAAPFVGFSPPAFLTVEAAVGIRFYPW